MGNDVSWHAGGPSPGRRTGRVPVVLVLLGAVLVLGPLVSQQRLAPSGWLSGVTLVVGLTALTGGAALLRLAHRRTVDDGPAAELAAEAPLLAHVALPTDLTSLPALRPGTPEAEVFDHLRVALGAETAQTARTVGRIIVAGVTTGDVNVWVGANLAISLADDGRRVLLVDARAGSRSGRPGEQEHDAAGLYDVLTGTPITPITSGARDVEAPETLTGSAFTPLVGAAQEEFDDIVVLAPALDLCDDARTMADGGGRLLLTVPEGVVTAEELRRQVERVRSVGVRLLGVVLVRRRSGRGWAW